ncbi:MAG: DUF4350 domain-containing protein [Persicimonas sp.]
MSKRLKIFVVGGLAFFIAALVGGFFITHERAERTVRESPSGEAKKDPNFALKRLVDEEGGTVSSTHRLREPGETAIVVLTSPPQLSPEQREAWRSWVSDEGGHLVMPAPYGASEEDDTLIDQLEIDFDESPPETAETQRYRIDRPGEGSLDEAPARADWVARDQDDELFAASQRVNYGRITLLRSAHILRNDSLGKGSHATLIFDILELDTSMDIDGSETLKNYDRPIVSIAQTTHRQSWFAYAFGRAWPMAPPLVLAFVFAIQRGRRRFGPLLPEPAPERRSRVEHIEATGRFLMEHGASAALVEASHAALLRALERSHPGLTTLPPRERNAAAAEILEIDHEEARRLLRPPSASGDHASFAQRIRQLERHRRRL